jgi:hypothetical protein
MMSSFKVGDIVKYSDAVEGEEDLRFRVIDAYGDCLEIQVYPRPQKLIAPIFREHIQHFERV